MTWFRRQTDRREVVRKVQEKVDKWEQEARRRLAAGEELQPGDFARLAEEMREGARGEQTARETAEGAGQARAQEAAARAQETAAREEAGKAPRRRAGEIMAELADLTATTPTAAELARAEAEEERDRERAREAAEDREWLAKMGVIWLNN